MPMTPTHRQGAASPMGTLGGLARHQSLEGGLEQAGTALGELPDTSP